MRVLVIADPHIPVPPEHYGGTERIVHLLCQGLYERGYVVDLVAGEGSRSYGGRLYKHTAPTLNYFSRAYRKLLFQLMLMVAARSADLVISFGRPDYLWSLYRTNKPIVVRFANPVDQAQINEVLIHRRHNLKFIGVSHDHVEGLEPHDLFNVVYNAIEPTRFPFLAKPTYPPYVVFLGRITENKGVHIAIHAARVSGLRLVIAGNVPADEPGAINYFREQIEPALGKDVEYIGSVDDATKATLLAGATAMLFPIQWREPFGIVMIEAMACGCPVIAWRNGSVAEVIQHGTTGFIVESTDEMARAIRDIDRIERANCRADVEARFCPDVLVEGDLKVFRSLLEA